MNLLTDWNSEDLRISAHFNIFQVVYLMIFLHVLGSAVDGFGPHNSAWNSSLSPNEGETEINKVSLVCRLQHCLFCII